MISKNPFFSKGLVSKNVFVGHGLMYGVKFGKIQTHRIIKATESIYICFHCFFTLMLHIPIFIVPVTLGFRTCPE